MPVLFMCRDKIIVLKVAFIDRLLNMKIKFQHLVYANILIVAYVLVLWSMAPHQTRLKSKPEALVEPDNLNNRNHAGDDDKTDNTPYFQKPTRKIETRKDSEPRIDHVQLHESHETRIYIPIAESINDHLKQLNKMAVDLNNTGNLPVATTRDFSKSSTKGQQPEVGTFDNIHVDCNLLAFGHDKRCQVPEHFVWPNDPRETITFIKFCQEKIAKCVHLYKESGQTAKSF